MWNNIEVITAMVTPFKDNGDIDYDAVKRLVSYLTDNGSDGILVAGTTGESPTLSHDEKLSLFKTVKETVGERIKVIAGTGSNSTKSTIDLSKEAEDTGVDALLLVTPYYNKPPQKGLINHFKAIANLTKLPIILYNVPGRTGVNMTPHTVASLAMESNIIGIKEASGNLEQAAQIMKSTKEQLADQNGNRKKDQFLLWSGDDSLTLPMLALGATGVISVASHLVGIEIKKMISEFNSGNHKRAQDIHERLLHFFHNCFITTNPIPIKGAMEMAGIIQEKMRPPLIELDPQEKNKLRESMIQLELLRETVA